MNLILFVIFYPIIILLSILPMRFLHAISDGIFYIIFYVIKYRVDIVKSNLSLVFPEKSAQEIDTIARDSIRHFCDTIMEVIKTFTISKKELAERFKYENIELVNELEKQGKSFVFMSAHYGNWEWLSSFAKQTSFVPFSIYSKLSNKYFDRVIRKSRSRVGTNMLNRKETFSTIQEYFDQNKIAGYGVLCDQSPRFESVRHWGNLLGQYVPVFTSFEFISKKYDFIVLTVLVTRVKRGYYTAKFELITDEPNNFKDYEITDKYLKSISEHIKKSPEFYLWTHKRFKALGKYKEWENTVKNKL